MERRERILDAVEPLFMEAGFNRVSTDEIAGAAGMSKKTVYSEFGSKSDLVRAVMQRKMGRIEVGLAAADGDPPAGAHELGPLTGYIAVVARELNAISRRFLDDLARYEPDQWQEMVAFRRGQVTTRFADHIRRGQQAGTIRADVKPEVITEMILTVADRMLRPDMLEALDLTTRDLLANLWSILGTGIILREPEGE